MVETVLYVLEDAGMVCSILFVTFYGSRNVAFLQLFCRLRHRATLQYRPLHYIFSLSSKWHDTWSDYSRMDQVFVLLLDQLTAIVAISSTFSFGK